MHYDEFRQRDHLDREELLGLAHGTLLKNVPEGFMMRMPVPPMLMLDRVTHISRNKNRGHITAERDVRLDDWFFQCHFITDPVQPGCLGVDAIWQMLGLYCTWNGGLGVGRALGVGEVDFSGQIRPHNKLVRYDVRVVRFVNFENSGACMAIGDGAVEVDGEIIYTLKRAKVGMFQGIAYRDYPARSENSVGGRIED